MEIKDKHGSQLWKVNSENARGQITEVQRGGKITKFGFDSKGLPTSIKATGIVNLNCDFGNDGNLNYRVDSIMGQKEMLGYDGMNRLINWDIYQNNVLVKPNSMVYNTNTGTITSKSDLDNLTMLYGDNGKPHALSGISGVPTNFPTDSLNVTYADFRKIKTLTEGNNYYILTYGIDDQRRKSEYKLNGITQKTKYYLGDYEEETDNLGNIKKIHYLSGGAILINTNGVETLYYGYSDYQGNLIALANEAGTVVERYAYDPWGKRRNPADWTQDDTRTSWIIDRGYTMHEHLEAFGIINMNGRVYDPLTAMFFSPDPFVQAPDNWLNYNRYSYVLNNPFKYTDPSGNLFYLIPTASYSYYGGLSVGISAGYGFPGGASIGGSVSYNFKQQNWTFTANASFSGLYAYAGYDTKAGVVAGAGFGFQSITAGNFSFPTNLFGASINYSGKGGMSLSMFGFNMGSDGIVFDPSITASTTFRFGGEIYESDGNAINYEEDSKLEFPYADDTALNEMIEAHISYKNYNIDKISAFDDYTTVDGVQNVFSDYFRDAQGYLWKITANGVTKSIGGVTTAYWSGWKVRSTILLSQIRDTKVFINTINHELTHAYLNAYYRRNWGGSDSEFKKFSESSAYTAGNSKIPTQYQNGIYRIILPPNLLPNPNFFFYPNAK